jgi:hypothetical protein
MVEGAALAVAGKPSPRSAGGIICLGGGSEVVHMKTQTIIAAAGVLLLMAAMSPSVAAKEATVTLEIRGMT